MFDLDPKLINFREWIKPYCINLFCHHITVWIHVQIFIYMSCSLYFLNVWRLDAFMIYDLWFMFKSFLVCYQTTNSSPYLHQSPFNRDGAMEELAELFPSQLAWTPGAEALKESFWMPGRVSGKNITICSAVTQDFLWKSNWNAELEVLFVQAV